VIGVTKSNLRTTLMISVFMGVYTSGFVRGIFTFL
jgi:hypothetical protein